MNFEEKIAQFSDSISWTPLVRGGHNYLAHELIIENEHKISIRATRKHILALSFFVGFCFFLLVVMSGLINSHLADKVIMTTATCSDLEKEYLLKIHDITSDILSKNKHKP